MGRLLGKKKKKDASDKDKKTKQPVDLVDAKVTKKETAVPEAKQIKAILLFSPRPVGEPKILLQQISKQQLSKGHTIAPKCIAKGIISSDPNDNKLIIQIIKKEFPDANIEELMKRTTVYPFQASDGNAGKYCIVFDCV